LLSSMWLVMSVCFHLTTSSTCAAFRPA